MGEPTENQLPVDQLAVEDLATEAAKAWKNIAELTRAYRAANDKFYPAKFEYNQALRDSSEGGVARRFAAKNTLKEIMSQENSAYAALLAGKKRFNDIQQRRIDVAKSVAAAGLRQQNVGDDANGEGGSVAGGAANAGRLIYSWLRKTTSGFFKSGTYVMHRMKRDVGRVDSRALRIGANDFLSAAFGSRSAIWDSKMFGRISGLLSGSKMGFVGAVVGLASDLLNNMADKAQVSSQMALRRNQHGIEYGMTDDEVREAERIGMKYGVSKEKGASDWLGFYSNLKMELNETALKGGIPRSLEEAAFYLGGLDYGNLLGEDADQNMDKLLKVIMDKMKTASQKQRSMALRSLRARGAAAKILTEGYLNYQSDKSEVTEIAEDNPDTKKAVEQGYRLRKAEAETERTHEGDIARHIEKKTNIAVGQETLKQGVNRTDALGAGMGFWAKTVSLLSRMSSITAAQGASAGFTPGMVIPSTVPVEAERAAASGGGSDDHSVKNEFKGDIYVQTTASNLEGVTEAAVAKGMASAYASAKK